MRLTSLVIVLCSLLAGCAKEETGFTSMIGNWKYTTPDSKIEVTFDIVGGDVELLTIKNFTIKVDGVEGKANIEFDAITETTIKLIRINANDAALVYPYDITLNNLSATPDFEILEAETASYIYPWPSSVSLTNIQVVRR